MGAMELIDLLFSDLREEWRGFVPVYGSGTP